MFDGSLLDVKKKKNVESEEIMQIAHNYYYENIICFLNSLKSDILVVLEYAMVNMTYMTDVWAESFTLELENNQ